MLTVIQLLVTHTSLLFRVRALGFSRAILIHDVDSWDLMPGLAALT